MQAGPAAREPQIAMARDQEVPNPRRQALLVRDNRNFSKAKMYHTIKGTQTNRSPTPGSQASSSMSRAPIDPPSQQQQQQQQQQQPQQGLKPQRKGMGRRTTSTTRIHRGQEFSVDDAEDEVDQMLQQQQQQQKQAKIASGSLRRVPSTLRRRPAAQPPILAKVDSTDDEDVAQESTSGARTPPELQPAGSSGDDTIRADDEGEEEEEANIDNGDDDADLSDAESFTLKDRQEAINETHPFGIRIWKPALYKKNRSVQKTAEGDIHSTPGGFVSPWLVLFNFLWTLVFGWWLAAIAAAGALVCFLLGFADGSVAYGSTFWGLAKYLFYPFGKYVKLVQEEAYLEEDEGEGRSISEYEQWQSGDIEEGRLFFGPSSNRGLVGRHRNSIDSADETQSLLGRPSRGSNADSGHGVGAKRRLFGRGKWSIGRVLFFIIFYGLLTPCLFLVSGICWLLVFTIPMGRVTYLLFDHLRRHPLALSFHSDISDIRRPDEPASSILLCTYRAVGVKYWKYTVDGTNIFLINLLGVVAFVIFDYFVLDEALGLEIALTNQFLVFTLALFSIIPLAYFIGQAVASISAQSSMGVGATINAFFSTVVEVFLYCVALKEGKAQLVEGSIIGSIFAGVLFLPGLSMCFGALKRKTQRFNVKSAGVTSTMLLFAVIGVFGPTLFYQIYGSVSPRIWLLLVSMLTGFSMNSTAETAVMVEQSRRTSVTVADATLTNLLLSTTASTSKLFGHSCGLLRSHSFFLMPLAFSSRFERTPPSSGAPRLKKRRLKRWTWQQMLSQPLDNSILNMRAESPSEITFRPMARLASRIRTFASRPCTSAFSANPSSRLVFPEAMMSTERSPRIAPNLTRRTSFLLRMRMITIMIIEASAASIFTGCRRKRITN